MKQITYLKPNMANLHGQLGKSIIETIMNTPKPNETKLKEEAHEIEKLMIAAEEVNRDADGQYENLPVTKNKGKMHESLRFVENAMNNSNRSLDSFRAERLSKYEIAD